MYLKKGYQQVLSSIKERKKLFLILVFLQLILIIAIAGAVTFYSLRILEGAKLIMDQVEQGNYDQEAIKEGQPFLQDVMPVYQGYGVLKENFTKMIIWLISIYLLLQGCLWVGSHQLLGKINNKGLIECWIKFASSSLFFICLSILIVYFITGASTALDEEAVYHLLKIIGFVLVITYFLMTASLAFIHKKKWKDFVLAFANNLGKIHLMLIIFVINLALITLNLYLIKLTQENVLFNIVFIITLIITLVFARLYWISSLNEIK